MTNYSNSFVAALANLFNNEGTMFFYDSIRDKVQKLVGFNLSTRNLKVEDHNDISSTMVSVDLLFETADDALDFRAFVLNKAIEETLNESSYALRDFSSIAAGFEANVNQKFVRRQREKFEQYKADQAAASIPVVEEEDYDGLLF